MPKPMLKSCKYCGRLHKEDFKCPKKPIYKHKETNAIKFRKSSIWQAKSKEIRKRDDYMCQLCAMDFMGTVYKYNPNNLHVHHIFSVEKYPKKKLENTNLIAVCDYHHRMCDASEVSVILLSWIANEQENKYKSFDNTTEYKHIDDIIGDYCQSLA